MTWSADVLTLYPEMFPGPLGKSLSGKAPVSYTHLTLPTIRTV